MLYFALKSVSYQNIDESWTRTKENLKAWPKSRFRTRSICHLFLHQITHQGSRLDQRAVDHEEQIKNYLDANC